MSSEAASLRAPSSARTREVLLDTAEELLARQGVAGTSIRDIITAAGTNLGAINYHFGSKDRLVMEVFLRRIRPVDQERIARLDAVEKAAGKGRLKLADVLDALIRPVVDAQENNAKQSTVFRLLGRVFQEVNPEVRALIQGEMAILAKRFDAAFLRAMPEMPPQELFWRVTFLIGALHFGLETWTDFDERPNPNPNIPPAQLDREAFIQRIIAFVTAGMSASVPKKSSARRTIS